DQKRIGENRFALFFGGDTPFDGIHEISGSKIYLFRPLWVAKKGPSRVSAQWGVGPGEIRGLIF
ncbi:MAG: hypothetical protein WCH85_08830, partial [Methanomicrobiales archaeon]